MSFLLLPYSPSAASTHVLRPPVAAVDQATVLGFSPRAARERGGVCGMTPIFLGSPSDALLGWWIWILGRGAPSDSKDERANMFDDY